MDRRTLLRLGGAGLVGTLAGCGGSGDDGPSETRVAMTDDLVFDPKEVTVAAGDTVVWETTGSVAHSATAYEADLPDGAAYFASGDFESESAARQAYPDGSVGSGETYRHTFEVAGEYPYFCIPHESGMRGTVVVE
ncbi:plastocyanin/azurin family copper-binding protein [Halomicroarcula sp. S1AR25-4]|uniref:cupredoxin domain-containing protein n=1 Tax=Haloarcula sp. S1AR25-4 TaxID=2950538 RepID=UPI002875C792|nr:plastocyanin/azurin family copper-binding protein [Halomicroarcula sp. S1AR25-4]MDS0277678.1 plastocyanin/azurin family copper-binding protein [Halomicroarcula sp. S1AR25-4]